MVSLTANFPARCVFSWKAGIQLSSQLSSCYRDVLHILYGELTYREARFCFAFQLSSYSVGKIKADLILFIYSLQSDSAYYVGERENKVLMYLFSFLAYGCFGFF